MRILSDDMENAESSLFDTAVYLPPIHTLSISDLHLGYEESLQKRGVLAPKFQLKDTQKRMERLFGHFPTQTLVINGDLKHSFGRIEESEWREIRHFVEFALKHVDTIIVVTGNHDITLGPILEKENIHAQKSYEHHGYLFAHGDEAIGYGRHLTIIAHDQPAITLSDGIRNERYKCYISTGKLLVQPSFHAITIGSDILTQQMTSPYLESTDAANWHIHIVSDSGDVFDFGILENNRSDATNLL
jgi:hypothetical protein